MIKDIDPEKLREFMDSLPAITDARSSFNYQRDHMIGNDAFRLRLEAKTCPCCGQVYCQRWYP